MRSSTASQRLGRGLQIESVGANIFLVAHLLGSDVSSTTDAGAFALDAGGVDLVRDLFFVLGGIALVSVMVLGWQRRVPPLRIATAILAVTVVLAPVLSPQFLFWVLPVSAAAFGLRLPNLLLMAAALLTQLMLSEYSGVEPLDDGFILALTARNLALVAYGVAAIAWAFRPDEAEEIAQPA